MINFCDNYFSYNTAGHFSSGGGWVHPHRVINDTEVMLILKGRVYITENGKEYELLPDNIMFLEAGKEHFGTKASDEEVSFYWFHFTTDMELPFKIYDGNVSVELKESFKRLLHTANTPLYSPVAADALGYLIFEELMRLGRNPTAGGSALLSNIKEIVRINLQKNITVGDISDMLGYNSDYLGKFFKKSTGIGLKEYIALAKINAAKSILLTTSKTIRQTAAELGFKDENLFIKFFIYHENITPSAYRSQYYNTHINNK